MIDWHQYLHLILSNDQAVNFWPVAQHKAYINCAVQDPIFNLMPRPLKSDYFNAGVFLPEFSHQAPPNKGRDAGYNPNPQLAHF